MYQSFDSLGYTMAINGTDSNHKLKFVEGLGAQPFLYFNYPRVYHHHDLYDKVSNVKRFCIRPKQIKDRLFMIENRPSFEKTFPTG